MDGILAIIDMDNASADEYRAYIIFEDFKNEIKVLKEYDYGDMSFSGREVLLYKAPSDTSFVRVLYFTWGGALLLIGTCGNVLSALVMMSRPMRYLSETRTNLRIVA